MPEYTISLDQPTRPAGDILEVPPYGAIANGESITVEAEREQVAFLADGYGITVTDKGGKKIRNTRKDEPPPEFVVVDESEGGESK